MTQPRQDHPQNLFWLAEADKAIAAAKQLALTPGVSGVSAVEYHHADGIIKSVVQTMRVQPLPNGSKEKS